MTGDEHDPGEHEYRETASASDTPQGDTPLAHAESAVGHAESAVETAAEETGNAATTAADSATSAALQEIKATLGNIGTALDGLGQAVHKLVEGGAAAAAHTVEGGGEVGETAAATADTVTAPANPNPPEKQADKKRRAHGAAGLMRKRGR